MFRQVTMAFGSEVLFIVICLNTEDFRMKNNLYSSSQRRTPWDEKKDLSPVQSFIRSEYLDTWNRHHPLLKETDEADFLNLLEVHCCRYCGSVDFKKNGYTFNGIQRYRCKDCSRTFTVLSNTLFDSHKVSIIEWIEYLLNLFGYVSFHSTSRNSRIADSTVKYWLFKLFDILKHYQDNIFLSGKVYIDETYYRVAKKDLVRKYDGTLKASENQYCIGIGYDGKRVYCKSEGLAIQTSYKKTCDTFIDHIEKGSSLIHDKERCHNILIEPLDLSSFACNSNECKKLKDEDNPLQPINDQCNLLKQFLNSHRGFSREYLQDYLNLYAFISNPPYDKLEKIEYLINCIISNVKIIRYRDVMSQKPDK